jgi:hypothetical protein
MIHEQVRVRATRCASFRQVLSSNTTATPAILTDVFIYIYIHPHLLNQISKYYIDEATIASVKFFPIHQ